MSQTTTHRRIAGLFSVLVLALLWSGTIQAEAIGGFVVPGSQAEDAETCVEATRDMRRYHMEFIRHQRDTTVYQGIRHTKYSLSGCVSCHTGHDASGTPIPINAPGQFCNACHVTAAVTLNCFDCHATVPDGEAWNQVSGSDQRHPHGAALAQRPLDARQEGSQER